MTEPVMIAVIVKDGKVRVLSAGVPVDCVVVNYDADAAHMVTMPLPEGLREAPPPPEYLATVIGAHAEVDWLFVEHVFDFVAERGNVGEEQPEK